MLELTNDRRRFGSSSLHELLRREELVQNHKRTERIYQEGNLSLRTRKRVKHPSHDHIVQAGPAGRTVGYGFCKRCPYGWDRSSPALAVDIRCLEFG